MSEKQNSLIDLPDSIDHAIQNLTDKPTQTIGETLSDMFFLVFGGVSHLAQKKRITYEHKLNLYKSKLEKSIEEIPSQNFAEPNLQTAGQALEDSKFCIESDELIDMFVNLISASVDSRKVSSVHPSFSSIIKQMSPFDAHTLLNFKKNSSYPICNYELTYPDESYVILAQNIFLTSQIEDDFIEKTSLSISALCHLGILETVWDRGPKDESAYTIFENNNYYEFLKSTYEENNCTIRIKRGAVALTVLGNSFCNACIPDSFS